MVRLLANFVVGVGDLGRQAEGRLEHLFGFLAQLLPGRFLLVAAQVAYAVLEVIDARVVRGQILADRFGDRFQFAGDRFGTFQLAAGLVGLKLRTPASATADEIADHRDQRERHGRRNGKVRHVHFRFRFLSNFDEQDGRRASARGFGPLHAGKTPYRNFALIPRMQKIPTNAATPITTIVSVRSIMLSRSQSV